MLLPPKTPTATTNDCGHRVNQRCTTMAKLVFVFRTACLCPNSCETNDDARQMRMTHQDTPQFVCVGSASGRPHWFLLAACSSGRSAGLSHPFRSLDESCRTWLLPKGRGAQRYRAPWLEWMSQSLSVLCWLEEYTLDTRGNSWQKQFASRRSKYFPERVRTGIRDGRIHPGALTHCHY